MKIRLTLLLMLLSTAVFSQTSPPLEPGVSQELAKWRAGHYSDLRYKLHLRLEKMSPVLKGTMEIRVNVSPVPFALMTPSGETISGKRPTLNVPPGTQMPPIILDWRKIRGFEERSTISNVAINGTAAVRSSSFSWPPVGDETSRGRVGPPEGGTPSFGEHNEHLIFNEGVVPGENVIKLDFTSPILPSGSAITRYVDKEDGSEYIYSLFVPSDASTAFPVFDQPDLKAKFQLSLTSPIEWAMMSNGDPIERLELSDDGKSGTTVFRTTFPISTYVFSFAAGNFLRFEDAQSKIYQGGAIRKTSLYVRRSQGEKFKPHATEVFRLNREAIKYFEEYFDYKFPWPKYDLVLIPEFPFGGMEHAGATFLREASVIFPQEPTKNDHINRATLIFHEAAHQWFGDTVTMRWFDDLWLKEGFATFTAYKAMERIMPEMNAWKVFYERVKQGAYQTDSTRGTTPIYQEIPNLSAAKSAYGNIVYNKAPAFLRQAEFYLGEDKFRAAVRSFLKKHEFGNATWEDLVKEFEVVRKEPMQDWAKQWVTVPGMPLVRVRRIDGGNGCFSFDLIQSTTDARSGNWIMYAKPLVRFVDGSSWSNNYRLEAGGSARGVCDGLSDARVDFFFANYQDFGYGIFLLNEKSRDYVLKNIQNEKDPFLRSMMWGALWDSVREGELDPREYVELVVKVQSSNFSLSSAAKGQAKACTLNCEDESTIALLLSRVGTALNYYIDEGPADKAASGLVGGTPTAPVGLRSRVEDMLIAGMHGAETQGQRITYYRALLNAAGSEKARRVMKEMLKGGNPSGSEGARSKKDASGGQNTLSTGRVSAPAASGQRDAGRSSQVIPLKTKDKFDIVTRLLILGDPEAPGLLARLEKAETSDEAKRYAYAARAGIATAENKAKYWKDFTENKEISESWIEAAFGPWNSIRHSELTLPYLERALKELPNHKRNRKIFFVNGWLGAFIGGQRSEEALAIVNKFLADNPNLDRDLRLKILENVDIIERAVKMRAKY